MRDQKVMRAVMRNKELFSSGLNNLLCMACMVENFIYMSQDDIKLPHISSDGVHLNSYGSAILMFNVFSVFSSFDVSFIDFRKDYEYALSLG